MKPKRRLQWWPMPLTDMDDDSMDEFYMSLAFLALFYLFCGVAYALNKYAGFFVLFLYFADFWYWIIVDGELTLAQKIQTFAQQTFVGLILTSPMIYLMNHPSAWIF